MMTLKFSNLTKLIFGFAPIILSLIFFSRLGIIMHNTTEPREIYIALGLGLMCMIFGVVFLLIINPRFQVVLNNEGIIPPKSLFINKQPLIQWGFIREFKDEKAGLFSGKTLYANFNNTKVKILVLNRTFTEEKKAIKFIISHLPEEKVDKKILSKFA